MPLELNLLQVELEEMNTEPLDIFTVLVETMINSRNYTRNKWLPQATENLNMQPREEENVEDACVYDVKRIEI